MKNTFVLVDNNRSFIEEQALYYLHFAIEQTACLMLFAAVMQQVTNVLHFVYDNKVLYISSNESYLLLAKAYKNTEA